MILLISVQFAYTPPGRRIPGAAARTPFRTLATETDLEPTERSINAIDQELKGAVQETKSIESRTASLTGRMVPQIDVRTQTTQTFLEDGTKELLPIHRYQRESSFDISASPAK